MSAALSFAEISTSYVERQNLPTLRMGSKRFPPRLSNGFSKKIDCHLAAVSLAVSARAICCDAFFETVLQRCIRKGLVGGEAFAIDASLIKADANRQKGIEGEKGLPPAGRPGGQRIYGRARR